MATQKAQANQSGESLDNCGLKMDRNEGKTIKGHDYTVTQQGNTYVIEIGGTVMESFTDWGSVKWYFHDRHVDLLHGWHFITSVMVKQFIETLRVAREVTLSLMDQDLYTEVMQGVEEYAEMSEVQAYLKNNLDLPRYPIAKRLLAHCKKLADALAQF